MSTIPLPLSGKPQAGIQPEAIDAPIDAVGSGEIMHTTASALVAGEVRVVPFVPEHLRPRMGGDHVPILGGPSDRALGQENRQKAS